MTKALLWIVGAVLVLAAVSRWDANRAEGERDAALYSLDTTKARNAEREVRWSAENDSLRGVVQRARNGLNRAHIRHDTAFVPITEWRYVVDTLIPECQRCAARSDSGIAQSRVERAITDTVIRLLRPRLRDRFGVTVGYGITKDGATLRAGPQVGVSVRVWP